MKNEEVIHQFYTSFARGNSEGMLAYYHPDIVFQDPAFGKLNGDRAFNMWRMLLSRKSESTKITFSLAESSEGYERANWQAEYFYGEKNRKVVNHIEARFKFKDGKIIEHIDHFNLWKWSQQALGLPGYLLGWTAFMKTKIQKITHQKLDRFIEKNLNE